MGTYTPGILGDRARRSGIVEAFAECRDCGWRCTSRNAVGLAAQHTDRMGHVVGTHQILVTTYGPNGTPLEELSMVRTREDG